MPSFKTGVVREIAAQNTDGSQLLIVDVDGVSRSAMLYPRYCAPASVGDEVVVNTTAVDLSLGTGGRDFVVWNLSVRSYSNPSGGHIMKLRYTPGQSDVLAAEAPESEHHSVLSDATSIEQMPVVACSLHSQLLPVLIGIRSRRPQAKVVYVMTDGAALELTFSDTVRTLRELGWLDGVITTGQAMGGDLETVNIYSGLLAAHHVMEADIAVVAMGPGVAGTSTTFGNSGIDLGLTINASVTLGGRTVVAARMSEGDNRDRHRGLSHHAHTALTKVVLDATDVTIVVPPGVEIPDLGAISRAEDEVPDLAKAMTEAQSHGLVASHMGRGPAEDPLFFSAAAAAGAFAADLGS